MASLTETERNKFIDEYIAELKIKDAQDKLGQQNNSNENNNFNQYDFVDVWTNYGDKNFKIEAIAGVNYFGKNDAIKDINHCYIKQLEIAKEISRLFVNSNLTFSLI